MGSATPVTLALRASGMCGWLRADGARHASDSPRVGSHSSALYRADDARLPGLSGAGQSMRPDQFIAQWTSVGAASEFHLA